jgi:hypothetical protein
MGKKGWGRWGPWGTIQVNYGGVGEYKENAKLVVIIFQGNAHIITV